ncbi:hypothetical protein BU15DRAFT_75942 [Melanogaster broomeanus]|nr:hypothetical protein BU15DRAFT_75942 [Melanogaster broomeanus]
MASPDVVSSALMLPIPILALALSSYNWWYHRTTPLKAGLLVLIAILSAAVGGTGLSAATTGGEQLRIVANSFANLFECALSGISLYTLMSSSRPGTLSPRVLRVFLALTAFLLACELVSALVKGSPPLLPLVLAATSRGILLVLAICTTFPSCSQDAAIQAEAGIETGRPTLKSSPGKTPPRVSSPTPHTWPFPASLASQSPPTTRSTETVASLAPWLTLTRTRECEDEDEHQNMDHAQGLCLLPAALVAAQAVSIVCATLNIAYGAVTGSSISDANASLTRILIAGAVCTLLWAILVLTIIHRESHFSVVGLNSYTARREYKFSPIHPSSTTTSDLTYDFLSLRDPFACPPPPLPPLPPFGLGLEEIEVGWNENLEIGVQYRFPAPRSGRGKGNKMRAGGKEHLVCQGSAHVLRPLPPLPTTRDTGADVEKDRGFGDEARLTQLLLQSLDESAEECESRHKPRATSPTVLPLSSRWSTSTTDRSMVTASSSNKSGMSTYASRWGHRKSSEAKRKSGATAFSLRF